MSVRTERGHTTPLSVVLITRNQAENVDRLVRSVTADTGSIPGTEVVLVDSASTDDTVARARVHPIRVLRLSSDQVLTAAAGRFVGCHATGGEYVLFLDGDMELVPGWLERALAAMNRDSEIGAVGGYVLDCPPGMGTAPILQEVSPGVLDVRSLGGAAMYRRSALDAAKGFNPYLYSDEEPELCLRIRRTGFRVVRLSVVMALHHSPPERAFRSMFARRRRRLYLGNGQAIRYLLGKPSLWAYLRERRIGLTAMALLVVLVAAVVAGATTDSRFLVASAALVSAVVIAGAIKKRSMRAACQSVLNRLFLVEGLVRGFLLPPKDPDTYPTTAEVIQ